jgi:hypothetical protein
MPPHFLARCDLLYPYLVREILGWGSMRQRMAGLVLAKMNTRTVVETFMDLAGRRECEQCC